MATFTNQSKNTVSVYGKSKTGYGWNYNNPDILYNDARYTYNTFGLPITYTNQSKNTVLVNNITKH